MSLLKPNNPITYRDIERCPYHPSEEPRYSIWHRNDDIRLEKFRKSRIRLIKRIFQLIFNHEQ